MPLFRGCRHPRLAMTASALALGLMLPIAAHAERVASANDLAVADRITFGLSPSLVADIDARGLDAWLKDQLHPASDDAGLPPDVAAMIDAMPHLHKSGDDQVTEINGLRKKADDAVKAYNAANPTPPIATPPGAPAAPATAMPPAQPATIANAAAPAPVAVPPQNSNQVFNMYRGETLTEVQNRRVLREIYGHDQLLSLIHI